LDRLAAGSRPSRATRWSPEHGLIDELHLSIHPVLAGHGRLLFWEAGKTPLELARVRTLGTGVVVLSYRPAPA
jgi:dihydrofolate reductase